VRVQVPPSPPQMKPTLSCKGWVLIMIETNAIYRARYQCPKQKPAAFLQRASNCVGARTYAPSGQPPVLSALRCFTTRFGMDRGGTTAPHARHWFRGQPPSQRCRSPRTMPLPCLPLGLAPAPAPPVPGRKPSSMRTRHLYPSPGLQCAPLPRSSSGGLTHL
jgi:hypothetical protein